MKDFDEWKKKLMDYYTLTGIDKCDDKVKVTTLRSYLSKHMHNILEFSIDIRDEDETTMDDVLDAIKKSYAQGEVFCSIGWNLKDTSKKKMRISNHSILQRNS